MLTALTREISSAFERCELTHLPRSPLDLDRARAQHDAYEWALVELGCTVRRLDSSADMPDAVFVEDTAVVLREGAVLARPGAESRHPELPAVAAALARLGLPLKQIRPPGTLDGGDVLVVGRRVFIGRSSRTNVAAAGQMRRLLEPLGYTVEIVAVRDCLHLKSGVAAVAPDTLVINRNWVSADAFAGFTVIDVDPDEPHAANALAVNGTVVYPATFPKTRALLERRGLRLRIVEVDELAKAEGGVTCCSLVFEL